VSPSSPVLPPGTVTLARPSILDIVPAGAMPTQESRALVCRSPVTGRRTALSKEAAEHSLNFSQGSGAMADVYTARGYGGQPVGFGQKPAVLVVDFQKGFTDPAYPMGAAPMVQTAVERTVGVMRAAKRAGVPVIACVIGFGTRGAAPHWKVGPVLDLMSGTAACDLDPRIAAEDPDVVLSKSPSSNFLNHANRL